MDGALVVGATASAAGSVLWACVGLALMRRTPPPEHRVAARVFATAWLCAAAYSATNAAISAWAARGSIPPGVALAGAWTNVVLGTSLVGCFVAHFVHLLTGHRRAVRYVLWAYLAQLAALCGIILALEPTGARSNGWTVPFDFARAPSSANPLLGAAILLPACVASLAYLAVIRTASTPTARWRIGLVGGCLTLWLLVATTMRIAFAPPELLAAARVLGAVCALGVVLAYWPPRFAQRRWGVASIRAEVGRAPPPPGILAAQRAALAARLRDLV